MYVYMYYMYTCIYMYIHVTWSDMTWQMTEGETTPPPLLQEADLIALMEKHGIGRYTVHV